MVRIRRLRVLLGRSRRMGKVGAFRKLFGRSLDQPLDQPVPELFVDLPAPPPLRIRQSIAAQRRNRAVGNLAALHWQE